jgi:predicted TIM-barrel fold metal-dependent hydrolase
MVIDFHCHVSTEPGPFKRYLQRAHEAGIDRTVLLAPHQTDYSRTNGLVESLVREDPVRLVGLVFIHPERDRGRVEAIVSEAVRSGRFAGIKVHGSEAEPGNEICRVADRYGLPILVDAYGKPELIAPLAARYPQVPFIVAHLGSFADNWPAQARTIRMLKRFDNVYSDTSGVRRFDALCTALDAAGPEKLLFGSDGPWLHPALELTKIKLLKLPPIEEAMVLGENARRLLARHLLLKS